VIDVEHHQLVLRYASLRIQDPAREGRLAASLASDGQLSPVLVIPVENRFVLIDGYARVAALARLGRDTVRAVELELDETQALVLQHRLENSRERSALEDGWLVRLLVESHGLTREEIGAKLQRSASWISRRLALVQTLPTAVQKQVRRGRMGAHGAERYLVPLARANADDCAALVANLSRRVSSRELREIYCAYISGDPEGRARVVSHPELLLQVVADDEQPEVPTTPDPLEHEGLLRDLRMTSGILRRAWRRAEVCPAAGDLAWSDALGRAWLELEVVFGNLARTLEERRAGAGPR
jgi:ParB family transcriptional regulator, chromosome partitioning protein